MRIPTMSYDDDYLYLENMNPEQMKAHARACQALSDRVSAHTGEGEAYYGKEDCVGLYKEEFNLYFIERDATEKRKLLEHNERQRLLVEGFFCIIKHNDEDTFEIIGPTEHMQDSPRNAERQCRLYRQAEKGSWQVIGKPIQGHAKASEQLGRIKTQRKFQNVA